MKLDDVTEENHEQFLREFRRDRRRLKIFDLWFLLTRHKRAFREFSRTLRRMFPSCPREEAAPALAKEPPEMRWWKAQPRCQSRCHQK